MVARRHRRTLLTLAVCALLAGCGGGDDDGGGGAEPTPAGNGGAESTPEGGGGQAADGEEIFATRCGSCHTLAAAGTEGTVGPVLDDLRPDAERVLNAIRTGPGVMPENVVTGEEAQAVADYVASAAGSGG